MQKHKVIIIGAGPAGLKAAEVLSDNGVDFVLLEKNPGIVRKVCGGFWGLTDKTRIMNVPDKLLDHKFRKVIFEKDEKKIEIKSSHYFVGTLDRKKLGEWMLKKIIDKDRVRFNIKIGKITDEYVMANGEKIYYDYLIGADGSNSVVRKYLKLPSKKVGVAMQFLFKRQTNEMRLVFDPKLFGPWYLWITPHCGLTSIGSGTLPNIATANQLKKSIEKWCDQQKISLQDAVFEAAPINLDYQGFRFGKVFLAGDAAGFASALTGEGIFFAMASGHDIANIIVDKTYKPVLIEEIVKIKSIHEDILKALMLNKHFTDIGYDLLLKLMFVEKIKNKAIDLIA